MSLKKFILNLLNAYSHEDFTRALKQQKNEIIKSYYNEIKKSHYNELKKSLSYLNEHMLNKCLSLSNSPIIFAIPYLSKNNLYFFIHIDIYNHQFDLKGKLCSFSIDINTYRDHNYHNPAAFLYCEVDLTKSKCKIIDIQSQYRRIGVASFMLEILEEIIKRYKIKKIAGWLSPADIDNRDLQVNFYAKNGFTIKFTDDKRKNGSIIKIINY